MSFFYACSWTLTNISEDNFPTFTIFKNAAEMTLGRPNFHRKTKNAFLSGLTFELELRTLSQEFIYLLAEHHRTEILTKRFIFYYHLLRDLLFKHLTLLEHNI